MGLSISIRHGVIALGAMMIGAFGAAPALADEAAEQFVTSVLDEAAPTLSATDETVLLDGIAALVDKYVDMRRVGLFTLGQYARKRKDEHRTEYLPFVPQHPPPLSPPPLSPSSFSHLFIPSSIDRSARDIIVNSKIAGARPGDQFADMVIHWRVYRNRDGEMAVVDAGADNIWLAIEQRSQFTSVIANNGGAPEGIDALIADLREQVGE